jgi:hypothetical protein
MVEVLYYLIRMVYAILTMSYEGFVTILLTAIAVMLAILALGIGILAIWGYVGLRDSVKEAATKHVTMAMDLKLKEYPPASALVELVTRMEAGLGSLEIIQKQIVSKPESKEVAKTSNSAVQEEKAKVGTDVTPIAKYPGEEQQNANASTAGPAPNGPPDADSGSDHS